MLSINPDAASRDDIARLASELMAARHAFSDLEDAIEGVEDISVMRGLISEFKAQGLGQSPYVPESGLL